MLVIGGIVDAGGEQHDSRVAAGGGGRHRFQRRQQFVRIVLDRRHAMAREQFREQPHHDLAVLQHVRDAGGRAGIVLEHVEGLGVDAHDVDAGDLHVDVVRHALPAHFRAEGGIAVDEIVGNDAGAQDVARAVDVLDEGVERLDALGEALLQQPPFAGRHDARDDVEGDQPLLRLGLAIDREGDADAAENELGLAPSIVEHVGRHFPEPARKLAIGGPQPAVGPVHLVEGDTHVGSPARHRFSSLHPAARPLKSLPTGGAAPQPLYGSKIASFRPSEKPRIYRGRHVGPAARRLACLNFGRRRWGQWAWAQGPA